MASATQLPLEEYLATQYEGPAPEYVDGEILERTVPGNDHSEIQWSLGSLFWEQRKTIPLHGRPELHVRTAEFRIRIVDLAIYLGERPEEQIPTTPPFIAIEILSPDDAMHSVLEKLDEYRAWGVPNVWLIDPASRELYVREPGNLRTVEEFATSDPEIRISAEQIFQG